MLARVQSPGAGRVNAGTVMRTVAWPIGLFLLMAGNMAEAASPAAFRGLDGNSREQDVLKVFPTAKLDWVCRSGETAQVSREGKASCEEIFLDPYIINDTDFRLTFIFNLDGTLRYVSILKIMGSYAGANSGVERSAIERLFFSLIEPLSAKFGPSVVDSPDDLHRSERYVGSIEWQPGNGRAWREGVDRVSLSAEAHERTKWPGTYVGSVHIWYSFVNRGELSKF